MPHSKKLKADKSFSSSSAIFNKRFVKLIACCPNRQTRRALVRTAPDGAIKGICNAALNVANNPSIKLSPADRSKLARHKKLFNQLLNRKISVRHKKAALLQTGGAIGAIIPLVLSALINTLGSVFFKRE
jgi:hypothetical protein